MRILCSHGAMLAHDDFFERPVIIDTRSWSSSSTESSINPWKLWASNAMILQRLKGCAAWKGTLNLRFDMAASPHQFGKMRVSFRFLLPASGTGTFDYNYCTGSSKASQQYGVDLVPSLPGGKQMAIPLIHWNDVVTTTTTGNFDQTGLLIYTPINALARDDSASSGSVTIVTRAWVTDMQRFMPTRYNAVAQSGVINLKSHSKLASPGFASQASSTISQIGRKLSEVPILSRAGERIMKAGNVGMALADFFGLSRPRDDQSAIRHIKGYSATAITDSGATVSSVAFTNKQGVDINVDDIGITDGDQMSLLYIASRNSYLRTLGFTSAMVYGDAIGTVYVTPVACNWFNDVVDYYDATSLAYASLPFCYWRGSLIFEFEVVCTNYQTGKIRISYDPSVGSGGTEDTTWPLGALENCVLDVVPGAKAEITVGWSNEDYWALVGDTFVKSNGTPTYANGAFSITVENILNVPLSSQSVPINVYVRAGPDFQLFGIKDQMPQYGVQAAGPSLVELADGAVAQSAINQNAPPVSKCHFGSPVGVPDELDSKVFGERIISLRALLKRYVSLGYGQATTDAFSSTNSVKSYSITTLTFPPDMAHTATTGNNLTYYTKGNLFRWFRIGYACCRGGSRFRIAPAQYVLADSISTDSITKATIGPLRVTATVFNGTGSTSLYAGSNTVIQLQTTSQSGGFPSVSGVGSSIADGDLLQEAEFEIPNYLPDRFTVMLAQTAGVSINAVDSYVNFKVSREMINAASTSSRVEVSFAVADDFSFFLWQGPITVTAI